ncbi:hypothetical protein B4N89_23005 [Embleya scabrispora]|uniref:Alkaline shock response membrane anchor protein AmaP n=1 Tax=Embleya scabrispora TaxID=159449 RepID=A0A1T3P2U9_9ACTN|nr:hypothetical protein [Embleya scabrispora]OPC83429.1 hypothetical protein B4N89_23005 [Embleya scabrispora]
MMRTVCNRILLFLAGLALIAGGLAVAARGRGWYPDLVHTADKPFITTSQAERLTDHGWWWWVAFGVPGLILVLALWWLLAQVGRRPVRSMRVHDTTDHAGDGPSGLGTGFGMVGDEADTLTVSGNALADAIEDDLAYVAGVEHVTAHLVRRRHGPTLQVLVRAEPGAEPRELLGAVRDRVLPNAREAVGLETLPTVLTLRTSRGLPKRHLD